MAQRTCTGRIDEPGRSARTAFTLIELLVVIFILGILVTLVVGVAQYVYTEAARKQTQTTQALVMSVIEAFRTEFDKPPADRDDPFLTDDNDYDADRSVDILLQYLTGDFEFDRDEAHYQYLVGSAPDAAADIEELNRRIRRVTLDGLLALPTDAYSPEAGDTDIRDGLDKEMRYERDGGHAGRPVLISAGPDGNFDIKDDNIRSDEY